MNNTSTEKKIRSSATENEYLSQLYLLLREGSKIVGARIAKRIGVSPSAVTQALKRLEKNDLVVLDPDDGISLTVKGQRQGERVIRRHYLLERLLVDELGFDWGHVDEEADRLEHSLSDRLEEHLYERLGKPTTCPHGNPFPGAKEEQRLLSAKRLSTVSLGDRMVILRITEEAEENVEMMRLLQKHELMPGTVITLVDRYEDRIVLKISGQVDPVSLPYELSRLVRVERSMTSA